MDPMSAMVLLTAQAGLKRAISSLAGEDLGGLAAAFLGLVYQSEQTQTRLVSIERKLDRFYDQAFERELSDGTRLLERAMQRGGGSSEREAELAEAQRRLERAVASTDNPLGKTSAERMAIIAQMLRGDVVAMKQSCRLLQAAAGDAVADAWSRISNPRAELRRRIDSGDYGPATMADKLGLATGWSDHRYGVAHQALTAETGETLDALAGLVNFGLQVSAILGSNTGFTAGGDGVVAPVRQSLYKQLEVDVDPGATYALAGMKVTVHRTKYTRSTERILRCTVEVDGYRRRAAECWLSKRLSDGSDTRPPVGTVPPGGSAEFSRTADTEAPVRYPLAAGGIVFAAGAFI
jgi:hypothetical protein